MRVNLNRGGCLARLGSCEGKAYHIFPLGPHRRLLEKLVNSGSIAGFSGARLLSQNGFGLVNMQNRAKKIGASRLWPDPSMQCEGAS